MRNKKVKIMMYITMLSAMAISLNLLEYMFIPPLPLGVRFGLANIIALISMKILGVKEMIAVNIMRVFLANLLRGLLFGMSFWISVSGIICSSIILIVCNKLNASIIFTAILSSLAHVIGQYLIVVTIYEQSAVWLWAPVSLAGSFIVGIITGFIAEMSLKRISKM
ncbi:MAG: Gx transporter family protein [Anaerorhabdus sp.]